MSDTTQLATQESNAEWKDVLEEILPSQGAWSEEKYLVLTDCRARFVEYTDGRLEVLPFPTKPAGVSELCLINKSPTSKRVSEGRLSLAN